MTSCGSVHPHLASLTNARFSAVLGWQLGCGPWGFYRSTRFLPAPLKQAPQAEH